MEQTAHVAAGMFPVREMDLFLWCRGFSLMQQLERAASHPELAVFPFPHFLPNPRLLGLELCHKKPPTLIPQCAIKIQIKNTTGPPLCVCGGGEGLGGGFLEEGLCGNLSQFPSCNQCLTFLFCASAPHL